VCALLDGLCCVHVIETLSFAWCTLQSGHLLKCYSTCFVTIIMVIASGVLREKVSSL